MEQHSNGAEQMQFVPNNKNVAIEMEESKPLSLSQKFEEDEEEDDQGSGWDDSDCDDSDGDVKEKGCICGRILSKVVEKIQGAVKSVVKGTQRLTRGYFIRGIWLIMYIAYFVTALCYRSSDEGAYRLIGCTVLLAVILFRHRISQVWRWVFRKVTGSDKLSPLCRKRLDKLRPFVRWALYVVLAAICIWSLIDEGTKKPENLRSIPGLIILIILCLFFSTKPSKINWHTIYWSLGLQFLFALFALRWESGREAFFWLQSRLDEFFANTKEGSKLLFGPGYAEHQIIFGSLPTFIFTNAAIAIMYYLGAMQFVVNSIGDFLEFVLDTTPIESVSVATGIFLEGIASVSAFIPYIKTATRSQLFLIMTSAFASLGGGYLALISSIQVPIEHLIAAMVISAPATFAVSKLMVPETQKIIKQKIDVGEEEKKKYTNILDAAQSGAMVMFAAVGHVAVNAFTLWSFISWINSTLTWFGDRVGIDNLTIEEISSYIFYPVSLGMGVEPDDCRNVAMLLGYRITSTNLVAFIKMVEMKFNRLQYNHYMLITNFTGPVTHQKNDIILNGWNMTLKDGFISERSEAIATYSLTGFSSFVSAAICLGVMFSFLPKRKIWLAKNTILALIAGNIANCMTGCFASLFY